MGLPAPALKALATRRSNPFQQFGQAADSCTDDGSLGCALTVLQFLTLNAKGVFYTHNTIADKTSYPCGGGPTNRGMFPSEMQEWFNYAKLPYAVKYHLTTAQLYSAAALGPVWFGCSYSRWPQWKGYVYKGITAKGTYNGFAALNGSTQLTGITGNRYPPSPTNADGHAGCLLGSGIGRTGFQVYVWEPNHGSTARPERPPYDIITGTQFSKLYNSYKNVLGRSLVAAIPTRTIT